MNRRTIIFGLAPVLFWIGVIFFLSSGSGSVEHTSRIIRPLLEFLFPTAPEETLQLYHFYIRKLAHFTEYTILGVLATRLFLALNFRRWVVVSLVLCVAVAALDEFNQSYVSSRTSSPSDVLIDCLGAAFAIGVVGYINRRRSTRVPSE